MCAQKNHFRTFVLGSLFGLSLAGCAANVGKTIQASDQQLAKYDSLAPTDAIAVLEKRINDAKSAGMPFYAPDYFRGASEILDDAKKSSDKAPKNELIANLAKADAILDKGQIMMSIVQSRLVNELAMKDQLDKDGVAKVYPKDYDNVIGGLSDLIGKVELQKDDNLDKDKIELIKSMQALDVKAIQYIALHESDVINEDTQSKDGETLAPATYAEALRMYQDAGNRIAQAPHDQDTVRRAGADALFAARHARYMTERVLALQNKFKESVEPIALEEEKFLLDISTALNQSDLRDQSIDKQAAGIAQAATDIVQGQQKAEQTIGAANDQSKILEMRLKQTDADLQQANAEVADRDAQIADENTQLTGLNAQISDRDAQIKALNDQVAQLQQETQQLQDENKSLRAAKSAKSKTRVKKTSPAPSN